MNLERNSQYILVALVLVTRVETSTDFATRVPDTYYPTGTRVLVTVNLVSD